MYHELIVSIRGREFPVLIEAQLEELDNRPPLFVVGLSSHYHDKFSEDIRKAYRIVLLDLYWTDEQCSNAYVSKLTIDTMASDIEAVREQLESRLGYKYKHIFFLGHSAYGLLALAYSSLYPSKVRGCITMGTPLHFNAESLTASQEEYLNSNFGNVAVGGPVERWSEYYRLKHDFLEQKADDSKQYFVNWYVSMGPLLWKKRALWQDLDGLATKLWNPWTLDIVTEQGNIVKRTHDVNMPMLHHFFDLIQKVDWRHKLIRSQVNILWMLGLYDSRVSLGHFEDMVKFKELPGNVECFFSEGGHWPMSGLDADVSSFNEKLITWGSEREEGSSLKLQSAL